MELPTPYRDIESFYYKKKITIYSKNSTDIGLLLCYNTTIKSDWRKFYAELLL